MSNVLVVGGAGYIGSHVCKALKESGFLPIVYDNLSTGHEWAVQFGPFVKADLEDKEALSHTFNHFLPVAVIHLASLINVRDSIANPMLYWEKNLVATLSLLKVMLQNNVKTLVFSSTAAIYGSPQYLPIDEKHPKVPLNAYGKTKWAIEVMLEDFAHAYEMNFAALRYFNASGADLSGLIGEAHNPETHLIPLVIQCALGLNEYLKIYGDDYPTRDGTAIRDYIHVSDLAAAHIKALEHLLEKKGSMQINLGTGSGFSVKDIVEAVEKYAKKKIPFKIVPRLSHDSPELIADAQKGTKILNWSPKFSDLSTIISSAWNWEIKHRRCN